MVRIFRLRVQGCSLLCVELEVLIGAAYPTGCAWLNSVPMSSGHLILVTIALLIVP
jgi:hypothetical protein